MGHKGHYGQYTGNAKWSKDHAHTKVTKGNYKASEKDDAAHIDYLKRDVLYDDHHGHSDEKMTADEKHISKLAGDLKYDEKKHGSALHQSIMVKSDGSAYTKEDADNEHKRKLAASVKDVSVESTRKGGAVGGGWIGGGKILSGAKQIGKFAAKHIAKKGGAKGVDEII